MLHNQVFSVKSFSWFSLSCLDGVSMTTQPGMGMPTAPGAQHVTWMTRLQQIPGCPVGMEYLTSIDQLLVKQQIELLEGTLGPTISPSS